MISSQNIVRRTWTSLCGQGHGNLSNTKFLAVTLTLLRATGRGQISLTMIAAVPLVLIDWINLIIDLKKSIYRHSAAASGWAGWALAHPDFGSSVNPITTRGADYAQCITASPPGFENLVAALFTVRALSCRCTFLNRVQKYLSWTNLCSKNLGQHVPQTTCISRP